MRQDCTAKPDEERFIEDLVLNPDPKERGSKQQIRKLLVRLLLAIQLLNKDNLTLKYREEQTPKKYKSSRALVAQFFIVLLAMTAFLTFHHTEITVDPSDGSIFATESSWWGIIKKHREIKWMKTDDYDDPGWMAKGKNGKWYLYIAENKDIGE